MEQRHRTVNDNESALERLAQLPFGLILFIVMIIGLSYYFDGKTTQVKAAPSTVSQIESQR